MATENKTQKTNNSVDAFLKKQSESTQQDTQVLLDMMQKITGEKPALWGTSLVGFGEYTYTYASGRTGQWFLLGFSPRKTALSIYATCDIADYAPILADLGPHKTGRGCLYIKRLSDVDVKVLEKFLKKAHKDIAHSKN